MRKIIAWIVPILVASNLLAQTSTFTDTATSTPLPTAKNTRTVTEERSWTATPTPTPLMTATEKFTETRTPTISISYTPTISDYTETKTPTKTFATETHTDTDTPTPTYASETFTETTSPTMTVTEVVTDSHTETDTATNTVTALTTHTATSTVTPTHTITITVTPTVTATMTVTFRYNDQDIGVSDDIDFYSALGWWRLHSGPDRDGLLQVGNYLRIQDQNTWQDALVVKMADKSSTFYGSINLVGGVVNMGCAPMTNVSQVRGCGDKPLTITGIGQDVVLTGNIIQVATNMEMDGNSIESGAIYPLATNTYDIGGLGFGYKRGYFFSLYANAWDSYSGAGVTIADDLFIDATATSNEFYAYNGYFDTLTPYTADYIYVGSDVEVDGAVTAAAITATTFDGTTFNGGYFIGDGAGVTGVSASMPATITATRGEFSAAVTAAGFAGGTFAGTTGSFSGAVTSASVTTEAVTATTGDIVATVGNVAAKDGGIVYAYSAGNDKSARLYHNDTNLYLKASTGRVNIASLDWTSYFEVANFIQLHTEAAGIMYLDAGGTFLFRDVDAANATRLTIDSATGGVTMTGALTGTTGNFSGAVTAASFTGAGTATKEVFVPVAVRYTGSFSAGYNANVGEYPVATVSDTQEAYFTFYIPSDFVSLTSAVIVCIPDATETIQWDIAVAVAAVGEDYDNDVTTAVNQTQAVTINDVTELSVATQMANAAANDYIGIHFESDTSSLRIIGLRIKYQ